MDSAVINLRWMIRLRFGATAGQAATVAAVALFSDLQIPTAALASVIAFEFLSNVALWLWARNRPSPPGWVVGAALALDVLIVTALLSLSGGAHNPFNFLYLVYVTLSAVVLKPRWTWSLLALSALCFGSLFFEAPWGDDRLSHAELMKMHLHGMWVAFVVAAAFVVYFVHRVSGELRQREQELAVARERSAKQERLTSLATLAAGAAHELSTPLSTIAVVSKELQQRLDRLGRGEESEDAALIRGQVERCRVVLAEMALDAGQPAGEAQGELSVRGLVEAALEPLSKLGPVQVRFEGDADHVFCQGPRRALVRALRGLAKNALQASPGADVQLTVQGTGSERRFIVRDRGPGMAPEVLARAGEPFFTTREPGQGMGLGLYLTRTVAESIGGRFEITSAPGQGTTSSLVIPVRARAAGVPANEVA